jgi:hypothetical protein
MVAELFLSFYLNVIPGVCYTFFTSFINTTLVLNSTNQMLL